MLSAEVVEIAYKDEYGRPEGKELLSAFSTKSII